MKTRKKILHTALELFNEKGFQEVGVREIARALTMSPGNLSYHFSKKEDILIELVKIYTQGNNRFHAVYFSGESTIQNFLALMQHTLRAQYKYRGLFISNPFLFEEIKKGDRINYSQTNKKRIGGFRKIFEGLTLEKQLKATPTDIDFLLSFISLFGRFGIQEAFMLHRERKEKEVLKHYILLLAKQMSLFATAKGKRSIDRFIKTQLAIT